MNDTIAAAQWAPPPPPPPPPPPQPNRRPRVREVNSRFLSSTSSSKSTTGAGADLHITPSVRSPKQRILTPAEFQASARLLHRSKTAQRRRHEQDTLLCSVADRENFLNVPDGTIRRSYSVSPPMGSHKYTNNKTLILPPAQGKQRRAAMKLFKENNAGGGEQQQLSDDQSKKSHTVTSDGKSSSRPDTPTALGLSSAADRIIPSRFRLSTSHNFHPSQTNKFTPASAATKLLKSSGLSLSAQRPTNSSLDIAIISHTNPCLVGDKVPSSDDLATATTQEEGRSTCPTSSDLVPNSSCRTRSLNVDMRSSMPDTRLLAERSSSSTSNNNVNDCYLNSKFSASPCSRSLNLPLLDSSVKMMSGSLCLPPHPTCTKVGATDTRKERKVFTQQEQLHSLRLLHNHYLQWRFANAKAETSLRAQTMDSERKLHSLGVKIAELRDAVKRRCIKLGLLQRTKTLSTILETHMPYLDEWSALEEEYSTSLSGTKHALINSLVRLPVSANIQADIGEVEEALNSAIKVMEMIGVHVQSFIPKANEMDDLISELARLAGGEKALTEECGDLLFKTYASQVEDCSLRGHLIQLRNSNHLKLQE